MRIERVIFSLLSNVFETLVPTAFAVGKRVRQCVMILASPYWSVTLLTSLKPACSLQIGSPPEFLTSFALGSNWRTSLLYIEFFGFRLPHFHASSCSFLRERETSEFVAIAWEAFSTVSMLPAGKLLLPSCLLLVTEALLFLIVRCRVTSAVPTFSVQQVSARSSCNEGFEAPPH